VRSRPATILRPAPAALPRPVPTAPLQHPIGGGHLHEASSGVHLRSPITPDGWVPPGTGKHHASRRSSPRLRPPDGTGAPWASTPGFAPRSHPRRTPRRRQAMRTGPGTTPSTSTSAEPPAVSPTCTHAPSRRTQSLVEVPSTASVLGGVCCGTTSLVGPRSPCDCRARWVGPRVDLLAVRGSGD
jgi:hypothetical protein